MSADGSITWAAVDAGVGPLPVKIRTVDGELVGTGVSGSPIAVPAGKYFVAVVQPDGRERGTNSAVTVEAGEDSKAGVQPQSPLPRSPPPRSPPPQPPPPPALSLRMAAMVPMAAPAGFAMAAAPPPEATDPPVPINVSPGEIVDSWLWKGDWFASWDSGQAARQGDLLSAGLGSAVPLSENVPMVITKPQSGDLLLALRVPGATRYSVVPFDECTACVGETPNAQEIAASLTLVGDTPNVRFRSTVAEETNTLLSFVDNGVLTEMWAVSEDMVNQGERAMYGAGGSLLRAVTGAYVLLRANQMDGLDAWLRTINGLSPSLPDIPVLRAELLARLGQHEDALDILRTAIGGRVPWFRSGLSYMLERVRLYIDVSGNPEVPFRISEDEMPRFVEARDRLQRMMLVLVRGRVMATFDVPDTPKP